MKRILRFHKVLFILMIAVMSGCVEPFDFQSEEFDKLLVVNSVLTDEVKSQEVYLSYTTPIDESFISPATGANVIVTDETNKEYTFYEIEPGKYISQNEFAAEENINYKLSVLTNEGREYFSDNVKLVSGKKDVNIRPVRIINNEGVEGVDILVSSFDETNSSVYYRYEYEETYKIIAPYWNADDIVPSNFGCGAPFNFVPKSTEQQTCYNTINSNRIIQTNTLGLNDDRVEDFSVRFINVDSTIIAHRYSILVKQYVQSRDAYSYYEKIQKSLESGNVLADEQVGFVEGNIYASSGDENVIGYFEVSSVVSNRIFFNFEDIFPNTEKPELECVLIAPSIREEDECSLLNYLEIGYRYVEDNDYPPSIYGNGPYVITQPKCGDCTEIGTSEVPEFWEE